MIDFGYGVYLDSFDKKDNEYARQWRNDPKIWRWCRQNDLISDIDQERWFESQSKDPSIKMYTIVARSAYEGSISATVGVCGLTSIDQINRRAEFSCYISPEHQKNGYAKAALKTLFQHGFDDLNLHLIWGETFVNNKAYYLFKSIGMKDEGLRRDFYYKDGRYWDCYLLSLLRHEFDELRGSWALSSRDL